MFTRSAIFVLCLTGVSFATSLAHAAGTVTVTKSGNTLTLSGDGGGNWVRVAMSADGSRCIIEGLAWQNGNTVINGPKEVPGFTGDLVVSLGHGEDKVTIVDSRLAFNTITINMGTGNREWVELANFTARGSLSVTSQATAIGAYPEASYIAVEYIKLAGNLRINTGTGSDDIRVRPSNNIALLIQGSITIDTRDGNDQISVARAGAQQPPSEIGAGLVIRTGTGNDIVSLHVRTDSTTVNLAEGNDTLHAQQCGTRGGPASLDGGLGTDTFVNFGGNSSLFTQGLTSFEVRK